MDGVKADYVFSHVSGVAHGGGEEYGTPGENTRALKDFADGKLDVLVNVRMLTEGTDVPGRSTERFPHPPNDQPDFANTDGRSCPPRARVWWDRKGVHRLVHRRLETSHQLG